MSKNQRGLGRGLGALIPTTPAGPALAEPPTQTTARPDRPSDMFFERTTPGTAATQASAHQAQVLGETVADPPAEPVPGLSVGSSAGAMGGDRDGVVGPVPGASFQEIPLEHIRANSRQPRQVFDDEALEELAHSIREFGVLQPVVVRPTPDGFELVMGERRLRAASAAGLAQIPAIVRDTDDDAMLRDALLENVHRAQLNPLEEAAAYQQLLEEFGVTHEQLAARLGRSRSQVSNTVRLMNLSVPVQRRVAAGVLSAGHARALLSLEDADAQDDLAARIVAEGLSVRSTEEMVALAGNRRGANARLTRRPARRLTAPAATELANRLSDVFDTRVRVDIGQRKGRITVEFATVDDLERIVAVMAPQLVSTQPADEGVAAQDSSGSV